MEIKYENDKLKEFCNNEKKVKKKFRAIVSEKLVITLKFIKNASNLLDVANFPSFHLHSLKGDRKGELSIYLGKTTGVRLIFEAINDDGNNIEINNYSTYKIVKIINILEIGDYHE